MPFQISGYTVPNTGAAVEYFVISRINLNMATQSIDVAVDGYVNQAAFANNLQPAYNQYITITGDTYNAFLASLTSADIPAGSAQGVLLAELISSLQQNMLTLPFFSSATIVS